LEHIAKYYEVVVFSDQLSMVSLARFFNNLACVQNLTQMKPFYMCSTLTLLWKDWIQNSVFGTGYQELQLNMRMENTIGYGDLLPAAHAVNCVADMSIIMVFLNMSYIGQSSFDY
jgi:hypothetical protein